MALTARNLLDRLAQMEGTDFTLWTEAKIAQRVAMINSALRWAWKTEQPKFAWPFTVSSGTVTVTDGLIDPTDLGDGSWCSLWSADPRSSSAYNVARPIEARVSEDGVHPNEDIGSVFAFYRNAVPQLTYVNGDSYANPSNIPDALGDIVPLRALSSLLVALKQWESVNALKATYGEPNDERDTLRSGISNSSLAWGTHALVLSPNTSAGTTLAWFTVANNYVSVVCPDGETRYLALSNDIP